MFRKGRDKRYPPQRDSRIRRSSVNDLRTKFGNAVLVFGGATIGNNKFHALTPCLGIRDLLQRKDFEILLLDEYQTSAQCPLCCGKDYGHKRLGLCVRNWLKVGIESRTLFSVFNFIVRSYMSEQLTDNKTYPFTTK